MLKYKNTNTHLWHVFVYVHAEFPRRLPLSPWEALMSLHQKQEIVTQQKGKLPLIYTCICVCMCVCVWATVSVFMCVTEGKISGGQGMITNCRIPQSGTSGLLVTPKLACCRGNGKSPAFIRKQQQPRRFSPKVCVWSACIYGNKSSVTRQCTYQEKC